MTSPVLQLPSYKVFLNQILHAKKNVEVFDVLKWSIKFLSKFDFRESLDFYIPVSNIWIQCTIVSIEDDSFIVNDGTGFGWITGISKLPKSSKAYFVNDYVMILGHILSAGPFTISITNHLLSTNISLCAKIKAIKVTAISTNQNCRDGKYWEKEVVDAQSYVISTIVKKE